MLKHILIVTKTTKYGMQRESFKHLTETEFKAKLLKEGKSYNRFMEHYKLNQSFAKNVYEAAKKYGDVKMVDGVSYSRIVPYDKNIDWASSIFSIGGDGTYLLAACKNRDHLKPVIGFNSNPKTSAGYLCLPKSYSENVEMIFKEIQQGKFQRLSRTRLRISLKNTNHETVLLKPICLYGTEKLDKIDCVIPPLELKPSSTTAVPFFALNDVFVGEVEDARTSNLKIWLNGEQPKVVKSTGLLCSTGTGATAWYNSLNQIQDHAMEEILEILQNFVALSGKPDAIDLTRKYNQNFSFKPDEKKFAYTIRELARVDNRAVTASDATRGFAAKVQVELNCLEGCIILDGGISYEVKDGVLVVMEIFPEDSLCAIVPLS